MIEVNWYELITTIGFLVSSIYAISIKLNQHVFVKKEECDRRHEKFQEKIDTKLEKIDIKIDNLLKIDEKIDNLLKIKLNK